MRVHGLALILIGLGLAAPGCSQGGRIPVNTQAQAKPSARAVVPTSAVARERVVFGPGSWVVLRANTWLHAHPDWTSLAFREIATDDPDDRSYRSFRVVRATDSWLELQSSVHEHDELGREWLSGLCSRSNDTLIQYGIHVFVKPSDVLPVTGRPVEHAFADGTFVNLPPGVPLGERRARNGWTLISLPDAAFHAPIPQEAIAYSFTPRARKRSVELFAHSDWKLVEDAHIAIASGEQIELSLFHPYQIENTPNGIFVVFEDACFTVRARVASRRHVTASEHQGYGVGYGRGLGTLFIRAEQAVYWPDGSRAGTTVKAIPVRSKQLEHHGDRVCQSLVLGRMGPEDERTLRVCFDPHSINGWPR